MMEKSKKVESDGLLITTHNGIMTIKLNRPTRKNALSPEMYKMITKILGDANDDDAVNIIVLTGTGDFFCSGNDLGNFMNANPTDIQTTAKAGVVMIREYVAAFIDLRKPLIAVLNGPAVGIAVTILGLCDAVFATDKATFNTPFCALGQSPEGCSSYIFPRIMGYVKANELLLFNQTFNAKQAQECGLVTQVYPDAQLQVESLKRINKMAELPIKSLIYSKELIRGRERKFLHEINRAECERLEERCLSEDCLTAVMNFFLTKSKM